MAANVSYLSVQRTETEHMKPGWLSNPFVRFFLWASKTDPRLMLLCAGSTRRTHVARGFFVLGTGLASCAASYYFVYATLGSKLAAGLIAPLCGALIFMFDRELVGGNTVRAAWVRITLSLLIGITIAIPFEMRLLQNRIDLLLKKQEQNQNAPAMQALKQQLAEIDAREVALHNQIADLRSQQQTAMRNKEAEVVGSMIAGETTGIKGKGPAYEAAQDRVHDLEGQIQAMSADITALDSDRARVEQQYKRQEITSVFDFPARYEALQTFVPRFSPLWRLGWMVTLLIVMFDMFPVMSKFLGKETDYDVLQRTEVAEIIHRAEKIAEHNHGTIESGYLEWQPSTLEAMERLAQQSGAAAMGAPEPAA